MLVRQGEVNLAEQTTADDLKDDNPHGPGAMLQAARLQKGLSEQEAADQLHLSQRWIKDMEVNAFSRAPALIYMRGYLRAYARLVELPPHQVLDAFDTMGWCESEAVDEQEWLRTMGEKARKERIYKLYRYIGWGFLGLTIIIVVSLFILWLIAVEKRSHTPAPTTNGTTIHPLTTPHSSNHNQPHYATVPKLTQPAAKHLITKQTKP